MSRCAVSDRGGGSMAFSDNRIPVQINRPFNSAIKLTISKVIYLFV